VSKFKEALKIILDAKSSGKELDFGLIKKGLQRIWLEEWKTYFLEGFWVIQLRKICVQ
jgi:hypothetical protein